MLEKTSHQVLNFGLWIGSFLVLAFIVWATHWQLALIQTILLTVAIQGIFRWGLVKYLHADFLNNWF